MASGVGKARPYAPSAAGPGSPRCATRADTIRTVADQVQFVVQIVFTTSSNTVGLRIIRPAPFVTPFQSGAPAAGGPAARPPPPPPPPVKGGAPGGGGEEGGGPPVGGDHGGPRGPKLRAA